MARPRQFDEQQVIESLMQVFWDKGYEATSMQDLVEASGLLKGSLYGAFGDKQSLYLAALDHYDRTRLQAGIDMLYGAGSARQKISGLFDSVIESVENGVFAGGCLLCNASLEMAAANQRVGNEVDKMIRRLHAAVIAAIDSPELPDDRVQDLAASIVSAYCGSRVLAKAGSPVDMIRATRDRCIEFLNPGAK